MKSLKYILFFFCLISIFNLKAQQYTVDQVPNVQLQNKNAFVSNPDNIISASTVASIDSILTNLRAENGTEFAVVLLNSDRKSVV